MATEQLSPARMEAFSDGVIAVIITIMVLELKIPTLVEQPNHLAALRQELPFLVVYLLSFVQTGIYWVNHHYLADDLEYITHGVLWANLAFLFGLSLIPFGTEWIGVRGVASMPVAVYCCCFVAPATAWTVLSMTICRNSGIRSAAGPVQQAISATVNVASVGVAFISPWSAIAMIAIVAFWWLLPPRRIVEQTHALRQRASRS